MPPTLSLLVLRCADVLASKRFYEALGLAFDAEEDASGPHWACRLGDLSMELHAGDGRPPAVRKLGFAVDDLPAALRAAVAAGGRVEGHPTRERAVVVAPDGRRVEVTQRADLSPSWQVWRQDDNGVRAVLQRNLRRDDAERIALAFESRGHKQMYWASRDG